MKQQKKRTKAYRPKRVHAPYLLAKLAPELTPEQRDHLDLVGFLALDAIRRGVGKPEHVKTIKMILQQGFVLKSAFDEEREGEIQALMYVALAGLMIAEAFIIDEHPEGVKHWMIDAAQAALELEADMERQLPAADLCYAARVVVENQRRIMPLQLRNIAVIEPGRPDTWKDAYSRTGICFLHGAAIPGVIDERGEHIYWWNTDLDISIRIEEPAVMVLSLDLPKDWRKRHERPSEQAA